MSQLTKSQILSNIKTQLEIQKQLVKQNHNDPRYKELEDLLQKALWKNIDELSNVNED